MKCSEVETYRIMSFELFHLPGYQGEGKVFIMFYLIIGGYYNTILFPTCTIFLLFHLKGSKILNGGSEAQDTNQSQHNGENAEEKKDRHEVGSKKK